MGNTRKRTSVIAIFVLALFLEGAAVVLQLTAGVTNGQFQNRPAWTIQNGKMRLSVLHSGGHIGEIALEHPGSVSPLWIQSRPTIDADKYQASKHAAIYGGGSGARLMSGLMGHNLCFPFWGDPSPEEAAAGMTFHGEAGIVPWRQVASGDDFLTVGAQFPESGTSFTRTIRLNGQIAQVEETAHNDKAWDRPVSWCEHVTLGPPFLERGVTEIEATVTRGRADGKTGEFQWPSGMAETKIDLRKVRDLPESQGYVNHFLVDPKREYAFFTAFHPKRHLVFGYVFPRAEFPWLNVWESNSPGMLTRGMEFSNTPVHGTMKKLVQTPELWGVPTFEWLDAKSDLKKRFWIFSLEVPNGFQGVGDVKFNDGRITVEEMTTSRGYPVP